MIFNTILQRNLLVRGGLLLDIQVLADLSVNSTLRLCGAVFVHQVLESTRPLSAVSKPNLVVHLLRGMHVSQRREAHIMQRVVWDIVFTKVSPAVFK